MLSIMPVAPWQADATNHRYHCARVPDMDLCAACFSAGKMPPGLSSSDFLRMDPPWKHDSDGTSHWTNQETLLLLEALEMHGACPPVASCPPVGVCRGVCSQQRSWSDCPG